VEDGLMKKALLFALALMVLFWCISCSSTIPVEEEVSAREFILYKPDNLPSNAPLVLALHGYGGSGARLQSYSGMDEAADIHGFAVVYPEGTLDNRGYSHWNANLSISSTDDLSFLVKLAEDLQAQHNLDSERTFAFGMSNGGFMSYALACGASDAFSAIASVTGTMSGFDWNDCNPAQPIPALRIHGVDDDVVPIDGSMSTWGGWGGAPHADEVVAFWANLNGTTTIDSVFLAPSTNAFYYRNGQNGNEVWYYRIDNWGHRWPRSSSDTGTIASEVISEFFSKF
jgi:polyhydroxybutyrate depolymerase